MQKLIKTLIVFTSIAAVTALTLGINIYQDREVIKKRTLTLEETVVQVGQNAEFPAQENMKRQLRDVDAMDKPLQRLATHAKILNQDLKDERHVNQALLVTNENIKDSLKSTEISLAESRSINRRLDASLDANQAELLAAQKKIDRMADQAKAQADEMAALNDQLLQKENDILGLEADLATVTSERDRAEKELDLSFGESPYPSGETKGLVAKVIKVNKEWNSVVIDVGSNQPVMRNAQAMVHRGESYVGMICIKDLDEYSSWGEIDTRMSAADIRVGDSVVF